MKLTTEAVHCTAPIVGTDWRAEMTQLIPGVNTGGGSGGSQRPGDYGVNGTQSYNVVIFCRMDRSGHRSPENYNGSNFHYPPIDSISEVSVNSGNAPAEYGNGLDFHQRHHQERNGPMARQCHMRLSRTPRSTPAASNNQTGAKAVEQLERIRRQRWRTGD